MVVDLQQQSRNPAHKLNLRTEKIQNELCEEYGQLYKKSNRREQDMDLLI